MKIVLATPLYPPEIGGPATYVKLLEEGLPGKGIEVEIVKFSEVRHLPKLIRHYVYYRRVCAAARKADAVLALDPVSVGFPVMWAAKKAEKPFAVKIVGDYAWEQGRQRFGVTDNLDVFVKTQQRSFAVRFLQSIQTRVARSATRIIVPSDYLKSIVTTWGISDEKIEVIYNAVPHDGFDNLVAGERGAALETVTAVSRPLIVTAGRLVPWKHIEGVIDAVANIPQASLAIIGEGPEHATLLKRAEEKIPGRFVFTGTLTHNEVLIVLKAADVCVLNSSYEGLSHLLIEAQSLGVPTVATRVGGNPEVITDNENGILVPVHNTVALTEAIARIVNNSDLRTHLSTHALESAKRFSIETMLSATASCIKKI